MSSVRCHSHESFGTGQRRSGEGDGGICRCGGGNWSIVIDSLFMFSGTIIFLPYEFTLALALGLLRVYGVYGVYTVYGIYGSAFVPRICFTALR